METKPDLCNLAFVAGDMAFWQGAKYTNNPYTDRNLAYEWGKGWLEAEEDNEAERQAQLQEDKDDYQTMVLKGLG